MKKSFLLLAATGILFSACSTNHWLYQLQTKSTCIKNNETSFAKVQQLATPYDQEFYVCAYGITSLHTYSWLPIKKLGLAFYTIAYYPERRDGFQNNLIRNIGIFDTAGISIRGSKQYNKYYGQEYDALTLQNLQQVWGKPDAVKQVRNLLYMVYRQRGVVVVCNGNRECVQLYVSKAKCP